MKAAGRKPVSLPSYRARRWSLVGILAIAALVLVWRAVDQQIFETDFLQEEGERRHLRVVEMPAHRGMITDREGEPWPSVHPWIRSGQTHVFSPRTGEGWSLWQRLCR